MPSKAITEILTITGIARRPSSPMGNPAYEIKGDDMHGGTGMTFRTQSNASVSYEISSSLIGKRVLLTLTPAWRITGIEVLSDS